MREKSSACEIIKTNPGLFRSTALENIRRKDAKLKYLIYFFVCFSAIFATSLFNIKGFADAAVYQNKNGMEFLFNNSQFIIFVIIVLGFAAAFLATNYLRSPRKADFYGSIPISRRKLFLINAISDYLFVILSIMLSILLAFVYFALKTSDVSLSNQLEYMSWLIMYLCCIFTLFYAIGLIGGVICGRIYSLVIFACGSFLSYHFLYVIFIELCDNEKFYKIVSSLPWLKELLISSLIYTFDITLFIPEYKNYAVFDMKRSLVLTCLLMLIISALIFTAVFLYVGKRKNECTDRPFVSTAGQELIKYFFMFTICNLIAWQVEMFSSPGDVLIYNNVYVLALAAGIIVITFIYLMINALLYGTLRKSASRIIGLPIFIICFYSYLHFMLVYVLI